MRIRMRYINLHFAYLLTYLLQLNSKKQYPELLRATTLNDGFQAEAEAEADSSEWPADTGEAGATLANNFEINSS